MKKIALLLFLSAAVTVVSAQSPINLGIKAGYNSSKLSIDSDQFNEGSINNFLAGAFLRLNLGKIYIQPEAYFNSKGGDLKEVTSGTVVKNFDFKTVDVPILLGVKVIDKGPFNLRANAGPLMSFITDKNVDGSGFSIDPDDIKDNFFGWQYGVGADFLFLSLDVRMENSSEVFQDTKNNMFVVSLGIKLL
ncbi:porin family protein [Sunxiuqinia sp. A32]|uniref:porin family protein n=1 Tax=Sunxiuqinia sp. A32 TaxID=3461496 RepID=UPI00404548CA